MSISADEWNSRYPEGTPVTAYPGFLPDYARRHRMPVPEGLKTRTRSRAWNLGHGEPVVKVEGYAGGISLDHVFVRTDSTPCRECGRSNGHKMDCGTGRRADTR